MPWVIIDAIPYFQRWKLQPEKVPTPQEQWECTKGVLFSHFAIELPAVRFALFLSLSACPDALDVLDMVFPSDGRGDWASHASGAVPVVEDDGTAGRVLLCL